MFRDGLFVFSAPWMADIESVRPNARPDDLETGDASALTPRPLRVELQATLLPCAGRPRECNNQGLQRSFTVRSKIKWPRSPSHPGPSAVSHSMPGHHLQFAEQASPYSTLDTGRRSERTRLPQR